MIANLSLIEILDFTNFKDTLRVFNQVEVFPIIFSGRKSKELGEIDLKQPNELAALDSVSGLRISQDLFKKTGNLFIIPKDKEEISLLTQLFNDKKYQKLGDVVRIGEGLRGTTIDKVTYEKLSQDEKNRYVKEIRGKNIRKFRLLDFNGYYKLRKDGQYYEKLKENILSRMTLTNEDEQFLKKIVISEMGSEIRATLVQTEKFAYGGTYYVTENRSFLGLYLLLGLFNSSLINFLFELIFHSGKWGTSFKFRAHYLEQLPFPLITEKNNHLVIKIMNKAKEIDENMKSITENDMKEYLDKHLHELNELIFELYEIPMNVLE